MSSGAGRVILGTAAYADPEFLAAACRRWPGRIAVDIAVRSGKAAISGWTRETAMPALELARKCEALGASWVIYTDILRDGAQQGINVESTRVFARALRIPVIASGGVSTIEDIVSLLPLEAGGGPGRDRGPGPVCGNLGFAGSHFPGGKEPEAEMLTKRIIPCLDVKDGRVVKGTNFIHLRDAGDPVENAREYDGQGADELTFLDITASSERRKIILDVVRRTAEEVFMPLTVGGGVRSLEDIRELLQAGADKVSINTAAVNNPELVREASEKFGSQCIVVAIDAKRKPASPERWSEAERALRGEDGLPLPVGLRSFLGSFYPRRKNAHRPGRPRVGSENGGLRRRGNSSHQHGPGWDQNRLRPSSDPDLLRLLEYSHHRLRGGRHLGTPAGGPGLREGGRRFGRLDLSLPAAYGRTGKGIPQGEGDSGAERFSVRLTP